MAIYSISVSTTSNATAGASSSNTALQMLMPASRDARLVAVLVKQQASASPEHSGTWVVDRISAVGSGSALTPLKTTPGSRASEITDTAKTISTTVAAANTVADAAVTTLSDGWNFFQPYGLIPEIRSGLNQGFAVRRAVAPTGSRVVDLTMMWEEL